VAKLKAPLLSLGAAGALAKTMVFFPWKGLNVVREYVIPSNPKTALQTAQRGYLTTSVALVHTAQARAAQPLDEIDQVAYSALAQAKGKIMTWFNQAVKLCVDTLVASKTPCIYSGRSEHDLSVTSFDWRIWLNEETPSDLAAGKFYFGSSKTNLIHQDVAVVAAGELVRTSGGDLSAFLTAGKKYYLQFRPDVADPCEGADSGIYNFVAE